MFPNYNSIVKDGGKPLITGLSLLNVSFSNSSSLLLIITSISSLPDRTNSDTALSSAPWKNLLWKSTACLESTLLSASSASALDAHSSTERFLTSNSSQARTRRWSSASRRVASEDTWANLDD